MAYFSFRYQTYSPGGAIANTQTRYYPYPATLTNAQAETQFMAMSVADRLAQSTTIAPTQTGWHPIVRRSDISVQDLGAIA